ncbi:MAG TPA: divergent polysaccharide deacetylase family protein [Candidatus Hydrogenedentes bacterium]|nr:divergent polysaccharide deacetylase family protein [Candidatus Hydrogenedentota bacterium]
MVGVTLLLIAGAAAAMLSVQHLRERPVNLRPHTARLAEEISGVLADYYVPEDAIERTPGVLLRDARSFWDLFRFRVDVPEDLNAEGLRHALRDTILKRYGAVLRAYENPEGGAVHFALGGRVFAEVVFHAPTPPPRVQVFLVPESLRVAEELPRLLATLGVPRDCCVPLGVLDREDDRAVWTLTRLEVTLPDGLSPAEVEAGIPKRLAEYNVHTRLVYRDAGAVLSVLSGDREFVEIVFPYHAASDIPNSSPVAGLPEPNDLPLESNGAADAANGPGENQPASLTQLRVAIILDDGGYGGPATEALWALDPNLTLAILPNTPLAEETATQAAALGFEVMLHMPMEIGGNARAFPGQINTDMDAGQIRALTEAALEQIPGVVGVNNHTGGKFTADAEAMRAFLEVIQEYGLYFIDSRTTASSVAYTEARALGVPCAARHVFLDNQPDREYIRGQFEQLIAVVKKRGEAVAIGHFRKETVAVLADMIPELEKEGIELVPASEIVR